MARSASFCWEYYNRGGFSQTYFEDPEDTMRFMRQFDREQGCVSVEYGMKQWLKTEDYQDINTAMVDTNQTSTRG